LAGIVVRLLGGPGQARGLPLREHLGAMAVAMVETDKGGHKACPYGNVWDDGGGDG